MAVYSSNSQKNSALRNASNNARTFSGAIFAMAPPLVLTKPRRAKPQRRRLAL